MSASLTPASITDKLREHYPGLKTSRLPLALLNLDFDKDILPAEEKLISQYGFLKEEVNFIMRYNPKFILLGENQKTRDIGIEAMHRYFVQEKGFELDTVRTLVVRYPYILSKKIEEF